MPLGPQGGTRSRTRARNDVDVVNIMTFDYYDRVTRDMGSAAISAAQGLLNRLTTQNPSKTTSELWAMEGNTILPGLDDYPRKTEATSLADAHGSSRSPSRTPSACCQCGQFAIASGAKGLTAVAVASLIEDGSLELSTTAASVLGRDLGDGGIYSTVADISSFWGALLAGQIVSAARAAELV